ncbi:MAG: hypothetical protein HYV99_02830 [Betaproteobacteria bacterium]|nr:hypothetical protein [Betaproteobacteria bacterium]
MALLPGGGISTFTGIAMQAGNQIIGGTGVLDAPLLQDIALRAANGVGSVALPVRIQDGTDATGPDLFFHNTSTTTGDIAVSFVAGGVTINDDVIGTFNANPNGAYSIQVETGNFTLDAPFLPGLTTADPLLAGQKVLVHAVAGDVIVNGPNGGPGGSIVTSGGGFTELIGNNVIQTAGSNISGTLNAFADIAISMTQAGDYTLGVMEAPTVTLTAT